MERIQVLSRHFDANCYLVAGMCRKCYAELPPQEKASAGMRGGLQLDDFTDSWPPPSPHHLVEETLRDDPWALLVATIFLNRTRAKVAKRFLRQFLQDYRRPQDVLRERDDGRALRVYFRDLGLQRRRACQVFRMSHDFVHKSWRDADDLYGIGRYGRDAFEMFCPSSGGAGNVADAICKSEPQDRFLRIYRAWFLRQSKQFDHWRDVSDVDIEKLRKNSTNCSFFGKF